MIILSGYFHDDDQNLCDTQNNIIINSCGRFELVKTREFRTIRPLGREDYQILYVSSGVVYVDIAGKELNIPANHIFMFKPFEPQKYHYSCNDSTVVYWIHFTGFEVLSILEKLEIISGQAISVGVNLQFRLIFDNIISELNRKDTYFVDMCSQYLRELLILFKRGNISSGAVGTRADILVDEAIQYFHDNFNKPIVIEEYSQLQNISTCWFCRIFKKYTGMTPTRYIISIRINKAKMLLVNESMNIGEISRIVGYDNPLYFSRLFKKYEKQSPRLFLQNIQQTHAKSPPISLELF